MRLFVAIELPKSFRAEAARLGAALRAESREGRFVPQQNYHITLHFIGESQNLAGAAAAMEEAVRGIRPFGLHLGHMDSFPRNEGHTAYLQVLGELSELNALYESLQSALAERGFPRPQKRFTPHVTLGRGIVLPEEALERLRSEPVNASMQVPGIALFESRRQESGVTYLPLHRASF